MKWANGNYDIEKKICKECKKLFQYKSFVIGMEAIRRWQLKLDTNAFCGQARPTERSLLVTEFK
jgi:hypothetical protein